MTAGGAIARITASRTVEKYRVARVASACTDCDAFLRSSQSLSFTNTRPEFWPVPVKLKPTTVSTPSTMLLSLVRK